MTGRDLRTIREACGVNMGELADEMGWRLPMLSDAEREEFSLREDQVRLWLASLGALVRARTPFAPLTPPR